MSKKVALLTNTNCTKNLKEVQRKFSGFVGLHNITHVCITRKKPDNIAHIRNTGTRFVVFDPASVPFGTAKNYARDISIVHPVAKIITIGMPDIEGTQNVASWTEAIKIII